MKAIRVRAKGPDGNHIPCIATFGREYILVEYPHTDNYWVVSKDNFVRVYETIDEDTACVPGPQSIEQYEATHEPIRAEPDRTTPNTNLTEGERNNGYSSRTRC